MTLKTCAALLSSLLLLAACETIEGAGQDISTAGENLTDTAQEVQNDL